jgi:ABC-type branched-subunit amino acid transport system substrate-binding protein
VIALTVAGCGARVSDKQIAAATGAGTGAANGTGAGAVLPGDAGAVGGSTATTAAGGTATGAATPGAATPGGTKPGGAAAGGAAAANTGAAAGATTATTAAAGDNGGATDKGVTANSITFANISTLTGPVPGLFAGAVTGTQAFFAYQNSQGGINGRQLKLQVGDDRFDCGTNKSLADQYQSSVFGFVGSFSLFDNCSAQVFMQHTDVPDIHNALSSDAQAEPNNFAAMPIKPGMSQGVINWIKSKFPDGIGAVGSLVGNVQSAKDAWVGQKQVMQAAGFNFVYEREYNPTETDFTADIVQMRAKGVKLVIEIAADVKAVARLESAGQQQNWKPQAWIGGSSVYDAQFLPLAGSAAEGTLIYNQLAMYLGEDKGSNPEVALMNQWVNKVRPGASLDLFTAYGWASGRLLAQAMQAAGPKVTRAGVLSALKNIHKFDSNGLLAPSDPGSKQPASCYIMIQVQGGKFVRYDSPPTGFRCDGPYAFAKT